MFLICYGTRPEWIKIFPLIKMMRKRKVSFKILFTGQQKDIASSEFADFKYQMKYLDGNRLDNIIKDCLSIPEEYFDGITKVIVQGDTATAFGIALSAYHKKIKVIHLEAGLRTYDKENPYPEEIYRQMISRIADIHLCPTSMNVQNLMNESVNGYICKVGNTAIDNLVDSYIQVSENNKVLVTLHRRENHDLMKEWFNEINDLAYSNKDLEFILPIHPNPNVQKHRHVLTNVKVIDPMEHDELINFIASCKMIITDSGGIQEEASFFNKKVVVCRKDTERKESLSLTSFLCKEPKDLNTLFNKLLNMKIANHRCPYGDGDSAKQILDVILYV